MRVVLTGASGFVGWHTRVRLRALTDHEVVPISQRTWRNLRESVAHADAVIHVAGINRGDPAEIERGNARIAEEVAEAVAATNRPTRLIYANSIQAGNSTAYGRGKARAGEILAEAAQTSGAHLRDVRLPNLFGEHGIPNYNSFVATFVDAIINGEQPKVVDRQLQLLHVQDAAQVLMDGLAADGGVIDVRGRHVSVQDVHNLLAYFHNAYKGADLPRLAEDFELSMFNTLRAAMFPHRYPFSLRTHSDSRGDLVESVRAQGGGGQTFVSTTRPGETRGNHFHLRKIERFIVVSGDARIRLRRLYSDKVTTFDVSGKRPMLVDMPTMWSHNITNTGERDLITLFWTNDLFNPDAPDTYSDAVEDAAMGPANA